MARVCSGAIRPLWFTRMFPKTSAVPAGRVGGSLFSANDDANGMDSNMHAADILFLKADFFSKKNSIIERNSSIYPV